MPKITYRDHIISNTYFAKTDVSTELLRTKRQRFFNKSNENMINKTVEIYHCNKLLLEEHKR